MSSEPSSHLHFVLAHVSNIQRLRESFLGFPLHWFGCGWFWFCPSSHSQVIIDWQTGLLQFNHCPTSCHPVQTRQVSIDNDDEDDQISFVPKDDEHLLLIDLTPAVELRAFQTKATQLAAEQAQTQPQKGFEELVPEYLHDYHDVFSPKDFDEIPPHRPWDHAIELLPDTTDQLNCKVYPLSQDEQHQLDEFIDKNLHTGHIRPSKSPMASPFFFVKKKDGKLRPVQDYHKLNEITVKNHYPLPLIGDLINALSKAKYFTKLDVRWGYNNI